MDLLVEIVWQRKRALALALLLLLASALMNLIWNRLVSRLIDLAAAGAAIELTLLALGAAAVVVSALLGFGAEYSSGVLWEDAGHDLRMRYAKALSCASLTTVEAMAASNAATVLQNELRAVCEFLRQNAFAVLDDAVRFLLTFSWMLLLDWRLAVFAHLPLLPVFFYIGWSSRAIGAATAKVREASSALNGWTEALTAAFPVIRVFRAEEPFRLWQGEALRAWREATSRAERRKAALMSLSGFLHVIPLLLLFAIGGSRVATGAIGIGTLYIFINLSGNVSGVVQNLPGRLAALRVFRADWTRLRGELAKLEDGR